MQWNGSEFTPKAGYPTGAQASLWQAHVVQNIIEIDIFLYYMHSLHLAFRRTGAAKEPRPMQITCNGLAL